MFEENQAKYIEDILNSGTAILVEGKKDRKVLEDVGLENILDISGKRLDDVSSQIRKKYTKVIILTDFDREGVIQYKRLKSLLMSDEVEVDDNSRRKFKKMFLVNRVEELVTYLR